MPAPNATSRSADRASPPRADGALAAREAGRVPAGDWRGVAGGHGGKSGRFERFHDTALEYAFIFRQLGISQ